MSGKPRNKTYTIRRGVPRNTTSAKLLREEGAAAGVVQRELRAAFHARVQDGCYQGRFERARLCQWYFGAMAAVDELA